jgi:hypothetical protein
MKGKFENLIEYTLGFNKSKKLKGLRGGKGGFGSLLKSIKGKNKTTNNMNDCRDL